MISLIIDFQCLESSRRSFCEHYFDVRVICEEDESVDSIALKAIATADRYPKDKGRYIFVILIWELWHSVNSTRVPQLSNIAEGLW